MTFATFLAMFILIGGFVYLFILALFYVIAYLDTRAEMGEPVFHGAFSKLNPYLMFDRAEKRAKATAKRKRAKR